MNLAADMGRHSGRATPSLHDAPYRQIEEATGRRSTYPLPILVQTNRASSTLHQAQEAFAKLKAHLRKSKARTIDALWQADGSICELNSPDECWNYL